MLKQVLISLLLLTGFSFCQRAPLTDMQKIISSIPSCTQLSILVIDAVKNKTLFEKNPALPLKPASNIKLFTTGASLLCFGNEFKIKTSIYFDKNKLNGSELQGSLYIKGFGNALFSTGDLDYLAGEAAKTGIIRINGGIVFDNSFFKKKKSAKTVTASLSPLDVPALSPLSINRNRIELTIESNTREVKITSSPSSRYIRIIKNIPPSKGGKAPDAILKEEDGEFIIIVNSLPTDGTVHKLYFFIKNPERLLALLLKEKLEMRGIKVYNNPVEGTLPLNGLTEISSSVLLADYIRETNKKSNNFLAEELRNIFESRYKGGSRKSGMPEISFLNTLGIQTKGLNFTDGNGISPSNKVTAQALTSLLHLIYTKPNLYKSYKQSLSIAGVDGTMEERFSNSPIKNSFYGKTGFMAGTSSISGYMHTKSGNDIIVTILINYKLQGIEYYEKIEKEILELIYYKY
jgi:serine-type D-Ala-D-Ala carboxypeptidase/endopeptidase (penicillin-binding protein 4)